MGIEMLFSTVWSMTYSSAIFNGMAWHNMLGRGRRVWDELRRYVLGLSAKVADYVNIFILFFDVSYFKDAPDALHQEVVVIGGINLV